MHNIQIKILKSMYDHEEGRWDEAVTFYDYIAKHTGIHKAELKPHMAELRRGAYVRLVRGLIREEDQGYYGSGHMLTANGKQAVVRMYPEPEPTQVTEEDLDAALGLITSTPRTIINTTRFNWTDWMLGRNPSGGNISTP